MEGYMKQFFLGTLLLAAALGLLSCASTPKVMKVTSLVPVSEADRKANKNGVTIEIVPVIATNLGEHPALSTRARILTKGFLETEPTPKDQTVQNVLAGLTFALKVTNNTGHILKMSGSDIGLSVSGRDARKLDKEGIKQLWVAWLAKEYEYQTGIPAEITTAIDRTPYWDENLKILPGKSMTCYASFDAQLQEGIGQATLAIYDLVTNTDQAGNATERTNFDFNLKELTTESTSSN